MQITGSNVTRWELRPDNAAAAAREQRIVREREARTATIASEVQALVEQLAARVDVTAPDAEQPAPQVDVRARLACRAC